MNALTKKSLQFVQLGAVTLSVGLSFMVGFLAQASSPNYERLFLSILPLAAMDLALIVLVCAAKCAKHKWLVAIPAFLGFASYFEMACRVWMGFRLL